MLPASTTTSRTVGAITGVAAVFGAVSALDVAGQQLGLPAFNLSATAIGMCLGMLTAFQKVAKCAENGYLYSKSDARAEEIRIEKRKEAERIPFEEKSVRSAQVRALYKAVRQQCIVK